MDMHASYFQEPKPRSQSRRLDNLNPFIQPDPKPNPLYQTAPAPTSEAFNFGVSPKNPNDGRTYIIELIDAVKNKKINPIDIDFSRISVCGASLNGLEVQGIGSKALSQISFNGCDLSGQTFNAPMRGFKAKGAKLYNTTFACDMPECNLEDAKCHNTKFVGGSAAGGSFARMTGSVHMKDFDFGGSGFGFAALSGVADNVKFDGIKARNFDMAGLAQKGDVTFQGAELHSPTVSQKQLSKLSNPKSGLATFAAPKVGAGGGIGGHLFAGVIAAPSAVA